MKYSVIAAVLLSLVPLSPAHERKGNLTVDSVIPDGPAAAAGLQAGDRFIRLDGRGISSMDDLQQVTAGHRPGDTVPVTVLREGETIDLSLTFGERPDGGVSIGVMLAVSVDPRAGSTRGTTECLEWIDKTYRVGSMMRDLNLDLSESYGTTLACVEHDTQRMTSANAVKYCDNVFKVHCSAIDLLTEIGEALVQRCEEQIEGSLGLKLEHYKGWSTCGQDKVFDRYSMSGESSGDESCAAVLLDECGINIDAVVESGGGTPDQREFVECCAADGLAPEGGDGRCRMIDGGFSRGPCHDRTVCVNRSTSEWIHCSVLE